MAWKKPGPHPKTEARDPHKEDEITATTPEEKEQVERILSATTPDPLPSGMKELPRSTVEYVDGDKVAIRTGEEVKTYPVFGLFILKAGRKIYPSQLTNGDAVELTLDRQGCITELRVL